MPSYFSYSENAKKTDLPYLSVCLSVCLSNYGVKSPFVKRVFVNSHAPPSSFFAANPLVSIIYDFPPPDKRGTAQKHFPHTAAEGAAARTPVVYPLPSLPAMSSTGTPFDAAMLFRSALPMVDCKLQTQKPTLSSM